MKLKTLAIAIAAASLSVSVQAYELDITGDINVGYFHNSDETGAADRGVQEEGSEINFDVKTDKINGVTFMAHTELDAEGLLQRDGVDGLHFEELRVGAKGRFGEIWLGDVQDACGKLQKGGDYHKFLGVDSHGCEADYEGTILYTRTFKYKSARDVKREIRGAVSYNPSMDIQSVALRYKHRKGMEFAIGYTDISTPAGGDDDTNENGIYAHASATVAFGPLELKTRVEEQKDAFAEYSVQGKFTFGNNAVYAGFENDFTDEDTISVGYRRQFDRSAFIVEARDDYGNGFDTSKMEYAVGISTEWK